MTTHIRPRFEALEDYSPGYVYGSIVSQSILYGLLLVPSAWALLLCLRRGFKQRAKLCMAFLILLMLGTSTAYLATSIVAAVTQYFTSSPEDIFFRSGTAQLFLPAINYIASDAIVLWRAWALCTTIGSRQAHIILIPSALLLGSFVAIIVSIICEVSQGYPLFITFDPDMATDGLFASWVLSLATNISATCIIGFKAWNHRKFVSANLTQRDGKLKSERILAVIVESGLLYCIFWFVLLVINLGFFFEPVYEGDVAAWNLGMILQDDSVHISAIYPAVIIVLVHYHMTVKDSFQPTTPTNHHISTYPRFSDRSRPSALASVEGLERSHTDQGTMVIHLEELGAEARSRSCSCTCAYHSIQDSKVGSKMDDEQGTDPISLPSDGV